MDDRQLVNHMRTPLIKKTAAVVILAQLALPYILDVGVVSAHAVPTHQNITGAAVRYLQDLANNNVPGVDPRFACTTDLDKKLAVGIDGEDTLWLARPVFHFDQALSLVAATCNSTEWGFSATSCLSLVNPAHAIPPLFSPLPVVNTHQWKTAIEAAPSGNGWREFGFVLHLLQDLASPAHVRNDAHPPGFDDDPLEVVKDRTPDTSSLGMVPLVEASTPESLFRSLGNFVRPRYFSADTVFQAPGPTYEAAQATEDEQYYKVGGKRVAYKGRRWREVRGYTGISNPTAATIDAPLADEQFLTLGPLAVRYSASLIALYLATAEALNPGLKLLQPCLLNKYVGSIAYEIPFTSPTGQALIRRASYDTFLEATPVFGTPSWNFSMVGRDALVDAKGNVISIGNIGTRSSRLQAVIVDPQHPPGTGIPPAGTTYELDSCYFNFGFASPCPGGPRVKFKVNHTDAKGTWDLTGAGASHEEHLTLEVSRVPK